MRLGVPGVPAAVSTAYINGPLADEDTEPDQEADQGLPSFGSTRTALPAAAVSVEMSPPQPSIARSLRLSPGQPVITVTISFDDLINGEPAGLTVVMLKPELFRVAIETTEAPVSAPLSPLYQAGGAGGRVDAGVTAGARGCQYRDCLVLMGALRPEFLMSAMTITEVPVRTSLLRLAPGTGNRLDTHALYLGRWEPRRRLRS